MGCDFAGELGRDWRADVDGFLPADGQDDCASDSDDDLRGNSRGDLRGDFDRDLDRELRGQDVGLSAGRLGPSAMTVLLVVSILFTIHSSSLSIHIGCLDFGLAGGNLYIYKELFSHTDRPSAPALISDH